MNVSLEKLSSIDHTLLALWYNFLYIIFKNECSTHKCIFIEKILNDNILAQMIIVVCLMFIKSKP
ncbi:hypothetical protein BpHYR1_044944 [Brachionus plicatilis]|uniref:Uncharacterized protein n=1 Tax=Brachionus plicatilis TaxID=10195 RepID=A0A3M7S091_BRAPC|nr:hypothetical protein BpHYR1_044944 [Brachionus plicatilis]